MTDDTYTTKIMEDAQTINKIMREIPLEDAKMVLVYAGALRDRSLLAGKKAEEPVAG